MVKAISYEDEAYTVAWFSPDLKTTSGPGALWGLPGLIIDFKSKYDQDGNLFKISGTAIKIKSFRKNIEIIKPNEGIPVKESELLEKISRDN